MSLKEVFSQDRAIDILQKAFGAGKNPHAYIFAGPDGVGRFKVAREWSKMLLCSESVKNGGFSDSCGSCESCRLFDAGSHPDFNHVYKELLEFTRDGKNKKAPLKFPIDVVREFVIEKASNKPSLSQRKVFVLDEGEKLSNQAQNCLLKILEEPPAYCTIILLCTRLENLLATTKSRCRILRFGPVSEDRIFDKIREINLPENQARFFARLAGGSLGQGLKWAQLETEGAELYKTKKQLIKSLSDCTYDQSLKLAQWIIEQGKKLAETWADFDKNTSKKDLSRRAQETLLGIIISALHDSMKMNLGQDSTVVNFDQSGLIKTLAGRFDCEICTERIEDCYLALRQIAANANEKLVFERLLLNFAHSDIMIPSGK
ncbi:MAG: DNA polymerase III subunit [Planctomycetota bacterium]|jgi:DNA polymerase-3 subunit delta'